MRGAYLEWETERSERLGTTNPVLPSFEATNDSYDRWRMHKEMTKNKQKQIPFIGLRRLAPWMGHLVHSGRLCR